MSGDRGAFETARAAITQLFEDAQQRIQEANEEATGNRLRREEARAALALASREVANVRASLGPLESEMGRAQLAGDDAEIRRLQERYAQLTDRLEEAEERLHLAEREFAESDIPDSLIASRRSTRLRDIEARAHVQRRELHELLDATYETKVRRDPTKVRSAALAAAPELAASRHPHSSRLPTEAPASEAGEG